MRCCGVKRSKATDRAVGRWRHQYAKYADSLSKRERKGRVFKVFHPETRFQKSAFIGTAFTGSTWTTGKNGAKHAFTQKKKVSM